jgi:hypothetical protein
MSNVKVARAVDRQLAKKRTPANPFAKSWVHVTTVHRLKPDDSLSKEVEKLRLAFVSLQHPADAEFREVNIPLCFDCNLGLTPSECYKALTCRDKKAQKCYRGFDADSCKRAMRLDRMNAGDEWKNYSTGLDMALRKHQANVVCFNEMATPSTSKGPQARFFKETRGISSESNALIIAGSFHDFRTKYNTGYLFTPNCPDEGWSFHKQTSAFDIGERISIPPLRQSVFTKAFGFGIGTLICLDVLDYSSVASLVNLGELIDFVLVPACSEDTQALERAAKIASQGMPGGVGIVNYNRQWKNSSSLYEFGDEVPPLISEELPNGSGFINIYETDRRKFKSRKQSDQETSGIVNWLFRSNNLDPA